jgi:hypothetical protein
MNSRNIDALEKCIKLMQAGVTLEDCIKNYPDLTPEVREILKTTKNVMNLKEEQVPVEIMNRNRIQLLSHAKLLISNDEQGKSGPGFYRSVMGIRRTLLKLLLLRPFVWRLALAIVVMALLIIFSRGLVITSAKSLPGDSLYPIKIAVEDISVYLVRYREVQQGYENNYNWQRVDEIKRLIELKRIQRISFEGILESQSDTNWVVSGVSVMLQADTTFVSGAEKAGSFKVGSVVEVEGITNLAGGVTANEIHLREYQYFGIVENINVNLWQVSGIQLIITSKTQIDDDIHVGDSVTVLVRSEDNGLYALAILRDLDPITTPIIQQSPTTPHVRSKVTAAGIEDQHKITDTLENTSEDNLMVDEQHQNNVGNPDISDDTEIGDSIISSNRMETNDNIEVLDVEKIVDENKLQRTTEISHESESPGSTIATTPSNDEKLANTATPEIHKTPEHMGEYGDNP